MAEFIKMPTLGFDMEEGTMGTWLKGIGEAITEGEVLAEIESDKVTQELTALSSGTLLQRVGEPGDAIPVGALLGIIGADGEDVSGMVGQLHGGGGGDSAAAPTAEAVPEPEAAAPVAAPAAPSGDALGSDFPGGVKATPVARRVAADKGIDLTQVNGTGAGGRIRKSDVEAFVAAGGSSALAAGAAVGVGAAVVGAGAIAATRQVTSSADIPETVEVPATRLRQAIARRMTESVNTVPPFYVTMAIDVTDALAMRKQVNASLPVDENGKPLEKVSVNDMIVKAVGLTLRQFPNLNASWDGDKVTRHGQINVGTAVAIEGGLLTVTQKNTDITSLRDVARQNREMIGRARIGKVSGEDIQGSTFTTSNLGAFGVDNFIGIINPPEAAILTIGGAIKTPVVKDGEIVVRDVMKLTIAADHRITDGAEAAAFMVHLKEILENPMKLLI